MTTYSPAPELDVSAWMGTPSPLSSLRGRVVLLETFQMLCPGCVRDGLPQVKRVQQAFPEVAVVGLHTVFEHHAAMGPTSLEAFLAEYRIDFPVGIDRHDGSDVPVTMRTYGLQGTPSTVLIDRAGRVRASAFGAMDDLILGAHLGRLLDEPALPAEAPAEGSAEGSAEPALATSATVATAERGQTCEPDAGCS